MGMQKVLFSSNNFSLRFSRIFVSIGFGTPGHQKRCYSKMSCECHAKNVYPCLHMRAYVVRTCAIRAHVNEKVCGVPYYLFNMSSAKHNFDDSITGLNGNLNVYIKKTPVLTVAL